jgi:hypothetical protein
MNAIQKIFSMFGERYLELYGDRMPKSHKKVIRDICDCRNGSFGTILDSCDDCDIVKPVPCCCGNRHCPSCQQYKSEEWLNRQMENLMPTHYFLLTITLPQGLREVARSREDLFVHTKPFTRILKGKFKDAMKKAKLFNKIDSSLWRNNWVVHSQAAGKGENALRYLSRYVFRVAISNNRIKSIGNDAIRFTYKDKERKTWKNTSLEPMEFIRRFLQHVLPEGFMKVRHYGFLNPNSSLSIEKLRELINIVHNLVTDIISKIPEIKKHVLKCPLCRKPLRFVTFLQPVSRLGPSG